MKLKLGVMIAVAASVAAVSLASAYGTSSSSPAAAVGAGGYDQSVFESAGPELTAIGMAQSFSGDGRYTVFESDAALTSDAVAGFRHVYRRSMTDGSIELVSSPRRDANEGSSFNPSISFDGNWVAFETTDMNVFPTDPGGDAIREVALVDMNSGDIVRVSTPLGSGDVVVRERESRNAMVSADGSHVVFSTDVSGMSNKGSPTTGTRSIVLFDRTDGSITGVSGGLDPDTGAPVAADGFSDEAAISADGRFIAYSSRATNITAASAVPASTAGGPAVSRVYRWDGIAGRSELVSSSQADTPGAPTLVEENSYSATISGDGRKVGYISGATNLLPSGGIEKTANHMTDAYVRIMGTTIVRRVSLLLWDEARPELPDSTGTTPSGMRGRVWFEAPISTTRIALAADGLSAVLTSMSPLLAIRGECSGCQSFSDSNAALDVYQVQLADDATPQSMSPISVKRTNQAISNRAITDITRESTTPGGDSIADGRTPATGDGSMVAFASQAGDLRGVAGNVKIQSQGPPQNLTNQWLPVYVDGGVPDESAEPVRTFTVAANVFNAHLHVPAWDRAELSGAPGSIIAYEARHTRLSDLDSLPISSTSTALLTPQVAPHGSRVSYSLTVTAKRSGSAEVVIDLLHFKLDKTIAVPAGWKRATRDAPHTMTFTRPDASQGEVAVFRFDLIVDDPTGASNSAVATSTVNNETRSAAEAALRVAPSTPTCVSSIAKPTVVAGNPTTLRGVQCAAVAPLSVRASRGSVSVDSSGVITYRANDAFRGDDTIIVVATDSSSRTSDEVHLPVTVIGAPQTAPDSYVVAEDSTLNVDAARGVLQNDQLPVETDEGLWRIQQGDPPAHGILELDARTGAFTFEPAPGFSGVTTFRYRVTGSGMWDKTVSDVVSVTITVADSND